MIQLLTTQVLRCFYVANSDMYEAVYTQTTRGKEQLLFCGYPFIYEKSMRLPTNETKKIWRCNQWYDEVFLDFCIEKF